MPRRQLAANKQYLQSVIREAEDATRELQSTNKELQSSNEELQSMNEELQTSQEGLQSVNEELAVNSELQRKMDELSKSNSDMNNLLAGTEIAAIFLDNKLRIKRFTPLATDMVKLIPSDIGSPLEQFAANLADENLVGDVKQVMNTLRYRDREVRTEQGQWRLIRIHPYRTEENVIDGAVITFTDITRTKQVRQSSEDARLFAESIVDTVREPLLVLDAGLRVITANRSFYTAFRVSRAETENRRFFELGQRQWDIPGLKKLLAGVLARNKAFSDFEVENDFPPIGKRTMLLTARGIEQQGEKKRMILLAIDDITVRRQAENAMKRLNETPEQHVADGHRRWKTLLKRRRPLIFITGYDIDEFKTGDLAGLIAFLSKPIDFDLLKDTLESLAKKHPRHK
ncbi:MAG: PAS domain-containing protein [Nitrospiraceae bacterium]|nr:PAS domain-containing protein [Nitrospiraceae bacterium]